MLSFIFAIMLIRNGVLVEDAPNWRAKGYVPAEQVTTVTTTTNAANAEVQLHYAMAWDLAATAQRYGLTNSLFGANLYQLNALILAETNIVIANGMRDDAARIAAIEANLYRYGGWESCLTQPGTETITVTTNTVWRAVPLTSN